MTDNRINTIKTPIVFLISIIIGIFDKKGYIMKKFIEGDKLTLEDVKAAIRESENAGRIMVNESADVKPVFKDGIAYFNSVEDVEKYYGGTVKPLEEVFK